MSLREVTVVGVGREGDGVALVSGRTVFVPHALPHERVIADFPEPNSSGESGNSSLPRLVQILEPSPHRRVPLCPHFGVCGGCGWLHATEEFQRSEKSRRLAQALEKSLEGTELFPPEVESVAPLFGYRRRTVLHAAGGVLGFSKRRSHQVIPIRKCLLLDDALNESLARLFDLFSSESSGTNVRLSKGCTDVALKSDGERVTASFVFSSKIPKDADRQISDISRRVGFVGAVLSRGEGAESACEVVFGKPLMSSVAPCAPGVRLYGRADLFSQAHVHAGEVLVTAILPFLPESGRVLELYGGNGTLTFAAASKCAAVTSVELCAPALALARKSASDASVKNLRCIAADSISTALDLGRSGEQFDTVLLDPPRAGAKNIAQAALAVGARRVVYVSCNPETFVLDATALVAKGFVPIFAKGFDLFPQTHHLEAVMVFDRES